MRRTLVVLAAIGLAAPVLGPPAAFAAYNEVEVADGGSVSGKVTFSGALPEDAVEQILITKNPEVCGEGNREVVWVDVADGALRGTFVYLDGIEEGKKWSAPEGGAYAIDQKDCRFTPWAQVVRPGSLTIRNSDAILHNINARELIGVEKGRVVKRTMFNLGQPDTGDIDQELQVRRSPFIAINCEAHNFMFGYMMAPEHPYAVVVDDKGEFTIDDVPPGTYTVKAWHPKLGLQEAEVTVAAGAAATADFEYSQ